MYKKDLIKAAADKAGVSGAEMQRAYDAIFDTISDTMSKGENVTLTGFGTFKVSHRKARKGRNPSTGATIDIPAKNVPQFSAGTALKDAVN